MTAKKLKYQNVNIEKLSLKIFNMKFGDGSSLYKHINESFEDIKKYVQHSVMNHGFKRKRQVFLEVYSSLVGD